MTDLSTSTTQPEQKPAEREPPVISPAAVTLDYAGQASRHLVVLAPAGLTFTDLNEHPTIWRRVQADRTGRALSEWDFIEIRSRDWVATARVSFAGPHEVVLFDIKRASKPERIGVILYSDDRYEVAWHPAGGYSYRRREDGVWMTSATWDRPEAAREALIREQYPARPM